MVNPGHEEASEPGIALDVSTMLDHSIALTGIYDHNEVLRYANEAFRQAYFVAPQEQIDWQTLMRRNFAAGRGTVIETTDIESWISSVRSRRGKSRQRTYESDLHDGRYIWVTETRRDDGWIIYVGTDITALNVSERKLRLENERLFRQSSTDELTGVSNRRHVLSKLQELLDAGQEAWACLMDIDHFKTINDAHGHQAGDEVLVTIAQTVRKTIKLADPFGRVGGEEFLVLFVGQRLDEVRSTLQRLREIIATLSALRTRPDHRITISGGLTLISPHDTQEQIFRRADLALYAAKRNGRNRFEVYDADVESAVLDNIVAYRSSYHGHLIRSAV